MVTIIKRLGRRLREHGIRTRIVVSDGRRTPTAKIVEELGSYDPTKNPPYLVFDREKAQGWIKKGASPSDTVKRLLVVKA